MTRKLQILATVALLLAAAFMGWRKISSASGPAESCDAECRVQRELALTDEQAAKIHQLVAAKQAQVETIFADFQPRMNESREKARGRLSQLLTAEQQQRFDAFLDEMRNRRPKFHTAKGVLLPHCKSHSKHHAKTEYAQDATGPAALARKNGRIDRLMSRLQLEAGQTEAVREVLSTLHDDIKPVKHEIKAQVGVLQKEVTTAVTAVLTPEQRIIWERMLADPSTLCETAETP